MNVITQCALYLAILAILAVPLGTYIGKVMNAEATWLSKIFGPCERAIYHLSGVNTDEDMGWKRYSACALAFSAVCFVVLFLMNLCQGFLPLNPEQMPGTSWHLAFNTTASFVTNTNWQTYSGESTLSYFTQMIGLNVQNFVSAAVGIAVLFAVIRGLVRTQSKGIGNFWRDCTRSVLYIMLPLCFVTALVLVWQGVPQTFAPYESAALLEPLPQDDGSIVEEQVLPLGPQASQVAPKQLGTNGGGFVGTNSAHPFENPSPLSNLFEMIALLLIPAALCFTFGRNVRDKKQGTALFVAMFLMLVVSVGSIAGLEQAATPQLAQNGQIDISSQNQPGGNMEGKESRFGIATTSTWSAFTTAASNGSVNGMHDSLTPLGGMVTMLQMQLGEVIFGGVGCGLYGMLAFAVLTVFIAGLMVGRTPEYLGKKIEPFEMKMAVIVCLATPTLILISSGLASVVPQVLASVQDSGPHGFSELLYTFTSAGGNNGSAFAGFNVNTPFLNVLVGVVMLLARFVPMVAILALAGSMAEKKKVAAGAGTLSTSNAMFVFLLIFVVLLVGALSFLPALALGPIAEYFQMLQ